MICVTRVPEDVLSELKVEAYRNAVRLFRDACTLYGAGGYPSSYALAVLSFEELGKVHGIDRVCDGICLNPESREEWLEHLLLHGLLANHRWKQEKAYFDSILGSGRASDNKERFVAGGGLDQTKQQALYVELQDWVVLTPSRITQAKAFALLQDVLAAFESSGDVAFFGFAGISTPKSDWLAREQLEVAKEAFAVCLRRNAEKGFDAR